MPDETRSVEADRLRIVEAELAAARRTIAALVRRSERAERPEAADRGALQRVIATLESTVHERERALEDSESHYRILYDNSPDAIITLDSQCRLVAANRAAEHLFGRGQDQLVGLPVASLLDTASGAALTGLLWAGFTGVGDVEVVLPDQRHLSFSVSRLSADRLLLVLRDVTQAHRLEVELLRTRRLAGAGRLAAQLAQEISTPLSVVLGRIELIEGSGRLDPNLQRQLGVMKDHARRIGGLVRNLHSFALPQPPHREHFSVRSGIEAALALAGRRLERLVVSVAVEPTDLPVHADRDQFAQMLSNLIATIADQNPAGTTVRLRARAVVDGSVRLTVEDDGVGLPESVVAELRSPYSGVRQPDPGLGIGLCIAWAIAQDHEGWLTAERLRPSGTAYHIHLPPVGAPAAVGPRAANTPRAILVVDDDQLLCETLSLILAGEGHHIQVAHSAEEALVLLNRARVDAVVSDIRLPGMDGESLVEQIEARWPHLLGRTLLCSGLLAKPRREGRYLQKPFTSEQLRRALATMMAESSPKTQ